MKPKGADFSRRGGGVLEPIVADHAGEVFVKVPAVVPKRLPRVLAALQEFDLGDSTPRRSNRVRPDTEHL